MSYHSGCNVNPAVGAAGVSVEQHGNSLPQEFPSEEVRSGQVVKGDTSGHLEHFAALNDFTVFCRPALYLFILLKQCGNFMHRSIPECVISCFSSLFFIWVFY